MRKTKNLTTTLKALLLIFALSFLCTIQSNAQSLESTPSTQMTPETKWDGFNSTTWNFFDWLKTIVTLDMSRRPDKEKPRQNTIGNTPDEKRFANVTSSPIIVTPDMTVRDPDNE